MSQTSTAILEHRVKAAELSKGTSGSGVYDLIERVITERGLTGKILDYGAGVGQLTRQLLDLHRFNSVSATDIMSVPRDLNGKVEWIEQDLNIPLPGHEDAFDVVVAAEVIEHLENPRFMIREIFRILRPGGTAIITTPNNESWRALIALLMRGHFMAFSDSCYPAHITALLRKDFTRIFQESFFHHRASGESTLHGPRDFSHLTYLAAPPLSPRRRTVTALIASLMRGHFMAFSDSCYPAHITALLRKDFTRIFQESSFLAPSFYFTNYGGLPGCPEVLRWQQISLGLLTGMRYSDNILAIAKKPLDP